MATPSTANLPDDRLKAASDWLFRLHEEDVGEAMVAEWIQWCESDPENIAAFEAMEATWKGLGELPEVARARLGTIAKLRASRRWVGPFAIAAAVTAIGIALGVIIWNDRSASPSRAAANTLQSGQARNQEATLPDGSHVALGAKSSLNIEFGANERRLKMRDGQAFFNVKPDLDHPFVVEAGPIEVRAVGTAFDVRKNEGRVVVSVTEGTVEVVAPRGESDQRSRVQVTEGYQLVWDNAGKEMKLAAADSASTTGWRTGRLEYLGEPLWAVIANVNRYASRPIEIEDAAIGQAQFTGTVFIGSIDDWVATLPQAFPVVVEQRRDGSVLIKRHP